MPSDQFEIPTTVKTDGNDDEYYVALPDLPATIDLSKVVFLVFHPREGETQGTLVIKPRESRRIAPQVSKGTRPRPALDEDQFLLEVRRAEDHFADGGYLGLGYFLTHWKSAKLPFGVDARKPILDRLIEDGRVEVYIAHDGKDALRIAKTS